MNPNEMNIIVWALALLLPILPALLFFIPKSSTAEASTDDSHAEKSPSEKVPFWAKWYNIPLGDYYLEVWASNPPKTYPFKITVLPYHDLPRIPIN